MEDGQSVSNEGVAGREKLMACTKRERELLVVVACFHETLIQSYASARLLGV